MQLITHRRNAAPQERHDPTHGILKRHRPMVEANHRSKAGVGRPLRDDIDAFSLTNEADLSGLRAELIKMDVGTATTIRVASR